MSRGFPFVLVCGRTTGNQNVPIHADGDGTLNGDGTPPVSPTGPQRIVVGVGRTLTGLLRPLRVNASGDVSKTA